MNKIDYSKAANRMRAAREASGLSFEDLSKLVGMSKSTLQRYETGGIKNMPIDSVIPLAKALNVSVEYLLGNLKDDLPPGAIPLEKRRIPILGVIMCGEPTYAEEDFEGYVGCGTKVQCDFALFAKGDSMIGARIHEGDLVFIRKQQTVNNGEIAAVIIDDETTLKRVRYVPGGITMLMAENPKYEPIIIGGEGETRVVKILGKAVAFQANVQ